MIGEIDTDREEAEEGDFVAFLKKRDMVDSILQQMGNLRFLPYWPNQLLVRNYRVLKIERNGHLIRDPTHDVLLTRMI
jgi:hypothetical protein